MNRKTILTLIATALANIVSAQTNTFPSSGRTGIGTGSTNLDYSLQVNVPAGSNHQGIAIFETDSGNKSATLTSWGSGDEGVLHLYNGGSETVRIHGANGVDSYINSGNVGIGTTNPASTFHISKDYAGTLFKVERTTTAAQGFLSFDVGNNNPWLKIQRGSNQQYGIRVGADGSSGGLFQIMDETNPRVTINEDGYVGVGTTNPSFELSVNGTVQAKEVIVETGWSDFVFEDSYRLRSLDEVESHIEEHGHLPDVPSAAVVESEGLSVGEAQKIMMQKIEELTLYMIAQDKKIRELESKLSQQSH